MTTVAFVFYLHKTLETPDGQFASTMTLLLTVTLKIVLAICFQVVTFPIARHLIGLLELKKGFPVLTADGAKGPSRSSPRQP